MQSRSGAATAITVEPSGAAASLTHRGLEVGPEWAGTPVLLVGTSAAVAGLRALLGTSGAAWSEAASWVLDGREGPGDPPLLPAGVRLAIVSLPESHAGVRASVSAQLAALGLSVRAVTPAIDLLATAPAPEAEARQRWRAPPVIDLEELTGRRPVALDRAAIARVLTGKRVLITGAGGSIGSHLALVAAEFGPESLILMERSENALFEIDRQLARRFPAVSRRALLHDIVDERETARHLAALRPQVVLHSAAHKHVPLMEDHPAHAVANNVMGTKSIADAAVACGAERFVMISTDKAVNPTSVMGATKRLAELYVRWLGASQERTRMSMVRFGNVLGSACSVLTIWSSQIAEGGPITITDPRMTRYFMTIPEAAALVIASTTLDDQPSGAVYVLEMGDPIRIADLAERFVLAHGLTPRVTIGVQSPGAGPGIDIIVTGARPGEKIHEELAYATENLLPTRHPGIRAWSGLSTTGDGAVHSDALKPSRAHIDAMIREMHSACRTGDPAAVVRTIRRFVPEMVRPERAAA